MPTLSIKNVPQPIVDRLRERASRNHRSMQGELMALLCGAVDEEAVSPSPFANPGRKAKTIEEIAAEHRARWHQPFDRSPRGVELIRGERDAG